MISNEYLAEQFRSVFSQAPQWISRAPGRVNLIGEHTDYNGGFVMPAAIERDTRMAAALNIAPNTPHSASHSPTHNSQPSTHNSFAAHCSLPTVHSLSHNSQLTTHNSFAAHCSLPTVHSLSHNSQPTTHNSPPSSLLRLHSLNFNTTCEVDLTDRPLRPCAETENAWANYILAVVDQFLRRGLEIPPMNIAIAGDVPLGAGLSSSAALEVCAAALFNLVTSAGIAPRDLALLAQSAEHSEFVGVRCGIMDQFIAALGRRGAALRIDCHSLEFERVPFDSAAARIMIVDSRKQRGLAGSEYNRRRSECEEGLKKICELEGRKFETLRHVPIEVFKRHAGQIPEPARRRVRHNLTENRRVMDFDKALRAGDWTRAGALLYESHASLRDDYEVSCPELDRIVEIARGCPGVFGCRMTGAGFGGCAVALVRPGAVEAAAETITRQYEAATGLCPEIYITSPAEGAEAHVLERA